MDHLHTFRVVKVNVVYHIYIYQNYPRKSSPNSTATSRIFWHFRTPLSLDKWRKTSQRRPGKRLDSTFRSKENDFQHSCHSWFTEAGKKASRMQTANNELLSTDCWTVRLSVEQQRSESKFRFGNWKRNSSGALTMPNTSRWGCLIDVGDFKRSL